MLRNMAMSLFLHRTIKTTDAKAKALRPVVDRIIATAKENTLASKRLVAKTVTQKEVFKKLYSDIVPHFSNRQSGFTRVMKLGFRKGDNAPISIVELLTPKAVEVAEPEKGKKKSATKAAAPTKAASTKKAPAKKAAANKKAPAKKAKAAK